MNKDIIKIDFNAKQVVEASNYSEEQIMNAVAVLQGFMVEDLKQKELDISNALQIMDHDLEDMSDEEIESCDAVAILKRRKSLRNNRREIKKLQGLQGKVKNNITIGNMNTIAKNTKEHFEKASKGSAEAFFKNSIERKTLKNKILLKHSRIKGYAIYSDSDK